MKKLFKRIVFILVMALLLQGIVPYNISYPDAAKKLKISANKLVLKVGQSKKLTVKGASKKVKWSSNNPKIAGVSKSGKVMAKKSGKAVITAKSSSRKAVCNVKVVKRKTPAKTPVPTKTPAPEVIQKPVATNTPEPVADTPPAVNTPGPVIIPNTLVPAEEVKVNMGGKEIVIGESVEQLKADFGEPSRIDETMYAYDYYIYNSDYAKFAMVAAANGEVAGVYTDALDFSYGTLNANCGIEDVNALFNKSYNLEKIISFTNNDYDYTICFDMIGTQKVTGIQVLKPGVSKRTGSPDDEKLLRNISLEIFDLTNSIRVRNGVAPLEWSDVAAGTAKAHSQDMADKNYFDHTNLDGLSPSQRMSDAGINWSSCGENISAGREASIAAANGWFNSERHRLNMLDGSFTHLGVGYAYNSSSTYRYYGTQNFYHQA